MVRTIKKLKAVKRYKSLFLPIAVFALLLWGGCVVCRVEPAILVTGIPEGIDLLKHMFPPEWSAFPELIGPSLETVQIAFVGKVMAQ